MKYLLILPALLCAALFFLWPIGTLAYYSMLKTNFISTSFVGLANYVKVFTDGAFLRSWVNSFAYMACMVTGNLVIGLSVALMTFTLGKRWIDSVRIIFYVPTLSAGIIIAQVWRWVFHAEGPLNWLLGRDVFWFAQGATAIPAISLIIVATGLGGTTIILLANILGIDGSLYDAARMDGATWTQIKLRIVLPLLRPTIAMVSLLAMIGAFQVFETIYSLAPYEYSATVTFHIYREAFQMGRFGYASAQAVLLLLVTIGLTLVKRRVERA